MEASDVILRCDEILMGATPFEVCMVRKQHGVKGLVFVYLGEQAKADAFEKAIEAARQQIGA
jgi:hypothetical protein